MENLTLTRRRAEAVVAYLVGRGVEESRLRARGYGETCPVAPDAEGEQSARNRRVELTVLETTDGPVQRPGACPPPQSEHADQEQ